MENIIYYLFLFFLVIVIRFFKLKNSYKENFKLKWREVFFTSLEIVYTASGIVIALILNVDKNWIAPVVMMYLVIVISSALLEMSNETLTTNVKTVLHSIIIMIVFLGTYMTYDKVIPKVDINGNSTTIKDSVFKKEFTIIIPYNDYSLSRHIGSSKLQNKHFFYKMSINTINKDSVYFLAMKMINTENLISPIYSSERTNDIEYLKDEIIILKEQ